MTDIFTTKKRYLGRLPRKRCFDADKHDVMKTPNKANLEKEKGPRGNYKS